MKSWSLPFRAVLLAALVLPGFAAAAENPPPPAVAADGPAAPVPPARPIRVRVSAKSGHGNERVAVGAGASLAAGERANAVVAVFGSADSAGEVADSVVAVLGDATVAGSVGDAVVAVGGRATVNGRVGGDVVAILGGVELGPEADIGGDVVVVGGGLTRDARAVVRGQVREIGLSGLWPREGQLHVWPRACLLQARWLGFDPGLGWAWWIAAGFVGFYALLALLFRGGVERCVQVLEERPGSTVLVTILTVLFVPLALLLLAVTIVGLLAVPFVAAALLGMALFGKAAVLAWIGRRAGAWAGGRRWAPALAVLVGGGVVALLYAVPFGGMLAFQLFTWLGTGVVVHTLFLAIRREKAVVAAVPVAPSAAPAAVGAPPVLVEPLADAVPPGTTEMPAVPPEVGLPRAGFGRRTGALLIDLFLVAIVLGVAGSLLPAALALSGPPFVPLAIYGAVLWRLKGTTVGGIICGVRVVRLDGRELDWGTAVVRSLACFLSLAAAGIGFLWVLIDDDRQAWHDKIAGTVVVRVPKGVPLV